MKSVALATLRPEMSSTMEVSPPMSRLAPVPCTNRSEGTA